MTKSKSTIFDAKINKTKLCIADAEKNLSTHKATLSSLLKEKEECEFTELKEYMKLNNISISDVKSNLLKK